MSASRAKAAAAIALAALCVAAVAVGRHLAGPRGTLKVDRRASARAAGDPNAPLWIVEYIDYQCSACRRASEAVRSRLEADPEGVYVQVRFYPMENHPHGFTSAVYAECAARQRKFFALHHLLFERQPEWSGLGDIGSTFRAYAREAGLDVDRLAACVEDPAAAEAVRAERRDAALLGVNATPTAFVNGKMLVGWRPIIDAIASPGDGEAVP
jgi:protein-disulfide isomerase